MVLPRGGTPGELARAGSGACRYGRRVSTPATPRIGQVVLDTLDARRSAEFWRQLLDLTYRDGHAPPPPGQDDPRGRDWLNLRSADGVAVMAFQQVDELVASTWPDASVPQQVHLDLTVPTLDDLRATIDHALALGASLRLDRTADPDEPLVVLGDPDGHPFCVFVVT